MNIKELIPKNKFDDRGIEDLQKLSLEQIKPIIPDLLEWLQDMNWPVARPVADVLLPFVDNISSEIIGIFKTNDGMWKYWVLLNLARYSTNPLVWSEIARIAKSPTKDEIMDEVNLEAVAVLNGDYN